MDVLGYEPGPITCEAAFIADFEISSVVPFGAMVTQIDSDRKQMDIRPGLVMKYVPVRFDPVTGARQIGGRYLFSTWSDVLGYARYTEEELEFEPGVKFWERPIFSNIARAAWRVEGAYLFHSLEHHMGSRVERYRYTADAASILTDAWPAIRESAAQGGRCSVWLLSRPEQKELMLFSSAAKVEVEDEWTTAARSIDRLEKAEGLLEPFASDLQAVKAFDRTSLNLSLWLPRSRQLSGASSIFPASPPYPLP
ncbi:hypothetical protein ACPOL_6580 [Acidisarcina polymorpha]|uniref:Uncharacterized protein n=1 Tax=Acidisarcina polymorpha TaxID=2211140 RepID=A0A2Z5G9W8_9BACT|nr:hypothetical protein [Acidisarcina polymorpha]AXC15798.1 hypothetical protein ACPOL_6580 [Acidisarcina polymorpha]